MLGQHATWPKGRLQNWVTNVVHVAHTILSANIKIRLHMKKLLGHVISAEDFPSNLTCVLGFTTTE